MAKFLTWLLCIFLLFAAVIVTGIHAVTHSFDGSHFLIGVGSLIALAIIATDRHADR